MATVHYVTHLKVERVEVTRAGELPGRHNPMDDRRAVAEVGSVTVKAESIERLGQKIAGHLALFD